MKEVLCDPLAWIDGELAELSAGDLRRQRLTYRGEDAATLTIDGQTLVNFAGNDYLGLTHDCAGGPGRQRSGVAVGSRAVPALW